MPEKWFDRNTIRVTVIIGIILILIGLFLIFFLSKRTPSFSLLEVTININGLGNFLFYLGIIYSLIGIILGVFKWVRKKK